MSRIIVTISMLSVLLTVGVTKSTAKPFPLNFNVDSLRVAEKNPAIFNDRLIAFNGTLTQLTFPYQNKPVFFVRFPGSNSKGEGIWVASLVTPEPKDLQIGHQVAVLGYFSRTQVDVSLEKAIHHAPYYVLGICLVNITIKIGSYSPAGKNECSQWQSGAIPRSESEIRPDSFKGERDSVNSQFKDR